MGSRSSQEPVWIHGDGILTLAAARVADSELGVLLGGGALAMLKVAKLHCIGIGMHGVEFKNDSAAAAHSCAACSDCQPRRLSTASRWG